MKRSPKIRDNTVDGRFFHALELMFEVEPSSEVMHDDPPEVREIVRRLAWKKDGPTVRSEEESIRLFESCIGLAKMLVAQSARKMEWRHHRIDDVEQNAMAALADAARRYDPELGKFSTWAYQFVDTAIHGMRRQEIRAQQRELGSLNELRGEEGTEWGESKTYEDALGGGNPFMSPEDAIELSDRRALLLEAMERLEPRKRELMECWLEEKPGKEIAEQMGLSPSRVSQLIQETFAELRKSIGEKMMTGVAYGM